MCHFCAFFDRKKNDLGFWSPELIRKLGKNDLDRSFFLFIIFAIFEFVPHIWYANGRHQDAHPTDSHPHKSAMPARLPSLLLLLLLVVGGQRVASSSSVASRWTISCSLARGWSTSWRNHYIPGGGVVLRLRWCPWLWCAVLLGLLCVPSAESLLTRLSIVAEPSVDSLVSRADLNCVAQTPLGNLWNPTFFLINILWHIRFGASRHLVIFDEIIFDQK